MSDCLFCKIVTANNPCHKVYEDELFLGFLDIKPLNIGNSLLIPKKHYRWVYDVPQFGPYWVAAKKIALATMPLVNASATSFLTLGYEIHHAHIRIVPRFDHDQHQHGIDTDKIVIQNPNQLASLAQLIAAKISI